MENNTIYSVRNVEFSYGENAVIKNMSFDIKEGKITSLIGANGCGKSTILSLLTKNLKIDKGEILLYGESLSKIGLNSFACKVASVHQCNIMPEDISVEELVSYGRIPCKKSKSWKGRIHDKERVEWAMEITDVIGMKDLPVTKLSGGQAQRVWIAMALCRDAEVLILDEPTTYLDIGYQRQLLKLVRKLNLELGITVVMVLHDINQAFNYSDEIVAIKEGRVLAHGSPQDVITEDNIRRLFDDEIDIIYADGKPVVLPI